MNRWMFLRVISIFLLFLSNAWAAIDNPADQCNRSGYSSSEKAGCRIWAEATTGNDRFHTYVIQQRLGVSIDWFDVLKAKDRLQRFAKWGLINDPDCCTPGSADCPVTAEQTYGFDYCPGDEELLKFVGKKLIDGKPYRDPACDLSDGPPAAADSHPHPAIDQRQDSCDLKFGTSTGALGLRKFPNPRFDPKIWQQVNGSLATWKAYGSMLAEEGRDSRVNRLIDGSLEPPFRIGMACGACHISFDPANPPQDPAAPEWKNIINVVGNQYLRMSDILASGMPRSSLEWQIFANARPGTVDTSAVPNDQVQNPGTMNTLNNLARRPVHDAEVVRWRGVESCAAGSDERACWCEPGRDNKCWARGLASEKVHHILKGAEDSVGAFEALQRVFINIGSCAEACWTNHITDLRQVDPAHRGFGQTPVDIGQCRRDCPEFRAVEDRLQDVMNFLFAQRPDELYQALKLDDRSDLAVWLEPHLGKGAVARGRDVFADNCASCHSSQPGPYENVDFFATDPNDPTLRLDWLGNDQLTAVAEVGTYSGRAFHANHMEGHIWEEYGSETMRNKPGDPTLPGPSDGGRGYYRNVSLISVWAQAPFMHNNAIGPEVCGNPEGGLESLYTSPYTDRATGELLENPPQCWNYDPSVAGRFKLYLASMKALLNPDQRIPKVTRLDHDVILDIGPRLKLSGDSEGTETGISIRLPKGLPSSRLGNLRHKELVDDLVLSAANPEAVEEKHGAERAAELQVLLKEIVGNPSGAIDTLLEHGELIRTLYSNNTELIENSGHRFGEGLSDKAKRDLTAFLATF